MMKQLAKVQEVENEGLIGMLEQNVTLFCANYIYTGKLTGVNDQFVKLEAASIVYETGAFTEKKWKDAQPLPNSVYVMASAIEMFTILK